LRVHLIQWTNGMSIGQQWIACEGCRSEQCINRIRASAFLPLRN
jgi:hypothetical protein